MAITGLERLALQEGQARDLAAAIKEVERHHKIPVLSPEKLAIVTLLWVAGRIYVPMARDVIAGKSDDKAPSPDQSTRQAAQPVTAAHVPAPSDVDWTDVLNPHAAEFPN